MDGNHGAPMHGVEFILDFNQNQIEMEGNCHSGTFHNIFNHTFMLIHHVNVRHYYE